MHRTRLNRLLRILDKTEEIAYTHTADYITGFNSMSVMHVCGTPSNAFGFALAMIQTNNVHPTNMKNTIINHASFERRTDEVQSYFGLSKHQTLRYFVPVKDLKHTKEQAMNTLVYMMATGEVCWNATLNDLNALEDGYAQ